MRKIFDYDGPVMTALGTLADLVFCNILFCLCALPLFTLGASLTALYDCTLHIVAQREESFIAGQFLRAFRRNFKQSTLLWLILLFGIVLLWAYSVIVGSMTGTLGRMYRVTCLVLIFVFAAGAQYVFPLQASYRLPLRGVLKNAWLLALAALPWTLCGLVIPVAAVYLSFFMNPAALNPAVFLWAFAVVAVIAYLQSYFYRRAFRNIRTNGTDR